ncbi:MAG: TrkH family potassium uptake protein [Syntrophomonas sp.]|nr:TrkH family potassium uptake protein [Syntrophomonas sp.]
MIRPTVVLGNLGRIILIIGLAMLSCLAWSIPYHEAVTIPILKAAAITLGCGLLLYLSSSRAQDINFKEGFILVSLSWLVASLFGSLPYIFSGYLPSFFDAFFETVSGFTTTGASVVSDVEAWPKGLVFWRSLTQWLGGMGIIALFIAVINTLGSRAKQLFKAEVPGPVSDSISPRIRENARILWTTYVVLSILCALAYKSFGMEAFDAICHAFTTLSTGGFSTKNASIAFYSNPLLQWAVILFMFLGGVNFALHFLCFRKRNPLIYLRNAEFRLYGMIILVVSLLVFFNLQDKWVTAGLEGTLRAAIFQIVSLVTTTGYATADFNLWPPLASTLILLMMFAGGCSGSTGGSIKPGRYLIIANRTIIELKKMVHPKAVFPLRFGGMMVRDDLLINVLQFFFLYIALTGLGTVIMTSLGLDFLSGFSAAATSIGNCGPGLGLVGPMSNFGFIPDAGKFTLSVLMLVGRLEIYPLLVLFLPSFWSD